MVFSTLLIEPKQPLVPAPSSVFRKWPFGAVLKNLHVEIEDSKKIDEESIFTSDENLCSFQGCSQQYKKSYPP